MTDEKCRKISILDTTLRDGEQAPGNAMNPEQKLKIATGLFEAGVNHIETGFPASSEFDYEATKLIRKHLPSAGIATFSRTLINDVKLALESGGTEYNHTVQIVVTGSDIHLKNKRNISRAQAVDEMCKTIEFIKNNSNCRIAMGIEDASRADYMFMKQLAKEAVSAGVHQIILADTTGFSLPQEYGNLIRFIKDSINDDISISTHCHNDLGLAVVNTLAGIEAGADEVQVTLGGIGERAGNSSLELIASILFYKLEHFNAYTSINLNKLYPLYCELCSIVNMNISRNKPLFGKYVFGTAAGIHQQGMLSDPDTYEFIKPDIFGRNREFFVSRHSGKSIIKYLLSKQNTINFDEKLISNLYEKFISTRYENSCISMEQLNQEIIKYIGN
ncbi:LeuA family protein [Gallibacterium anatis]|uniref:2-isopropylmalate synthase n=1 Tax=Gallibacterium anatis TaxID=750 RepID=A0A921HD40_9PAST|nr:LeuA family protein [Gallibacterium anatis]WIM83981.1 LeuA family protein [Gallibacterium anatis]HJF74673.1 LeuA family protein [Gallibacterium anatis]